MLSPPHLAPGEPAEDKTFALTRLPDELILSVLQETDPLALYSVARVNSRLRGLCREPRVLTAVLPPEQHAAGRNEAERGPASTPSWMQVVSRARLAIFAQGIAAGGRLDVTLTNAYESVEVSSDRRWILASGAPDGAKLFDLARNGRESMLPAAEGCFSPDARLLCAFDSAEEAVFLYNLEAPGLLPYPVQARSAQSASSSMTFSDRGQWLVRSLPEREELFLTADIFRQQSSSSVVASAGCFLFSSTDRFVLGCADDFGYGDATLYDAFGPSTALVVSRSHLNPSNLRHRRFHLIGSWLLAEVTNTLTQGESTYVARAEERPLEWREVTGLTTQGARNRWWLTPTQWPSRVFATRRDQVPLLLDLALLARAADAETQLPAWRMHDAVAYEAHPPRVYEIDQQVHFLLPSGLWAIYGGDPQRGLRLRSIFPSLRRAMHDPYDTAGTLRLHGCIGHDRVMLKQSIHGSSGLPVPFMEPGDPLECRLTIAPADAPEMPTHRFVHSEQPDSRALWSEPLQLLVQTLGAFENLSPFWDGSERREQTFLYRLSLNGAGTEYSIMLQDGWRFVDFLEDACGVLLRDAEGTLRVVPLVNLEDPFAELRE